MADTRSWSRYLFFIWDTVVSMTLVVLSVLLLTLPSSSISVFPLYLAWQVVSLVFIVSSLIVPRVEHWARRQWRPGWVALLPLLAGLVGVQSAVWALLVQSHATEDLEAAVVAGVAASGVLLSWMLVHLGFAEIYALVDRRGTTPAFAFPGEEDHTAVKYIYFSVTIGTSFAVSDVTTLSRRARAVVAVHSVISFAYNALAVAIAFQVLQGLAATAGA